VASIIAEGCQFNGTVDVNGNIRVDGRFDGKMTVSDTLVVGKTGVVKAEVKTKTATIAGNLNGEIHAREGVKLQSGSRFEGNIYTKNLVIEEGVYFDGGCWRSMEGKGKAENQSRPKPDVKNASPGHAPAGTAGQGR